MDDHHVGLTGSPVGFLAALRPAAAAAVRVDEVELVTPRRAAVVDPQSGVR
jgi:hypothetical protein